VLAGLPRRRADPHDGAEGVGQVVGELAAPAGAGEPGEERAGDGAGVEAAGLRVPERVLAEGRRGGGAERGVRVGERRVEPEEGREGSRAPPGVATASPASAARSAAAAAAPTAASAIHASPSVRNSVRARRSKSEQKRSA
jgi:hypothetical protein